MKHLKRLPAVHIHPVLYVFILISFLTGTLVELMVIFSIVLVHEAGHYLAASHYNWRVKNVILWVFGGVMDTDEHGNRSIKEEAVVTLAGPAMHLLIYMVCFFLEIFQLFPPAILELIIHYNTIIFLFNMLPVWPLDGGKILCLFASSFCPYRKAYQFTLFFSILSCILIIIVQLFLLPFTLSSFFIWVFLLAENRTEWKKRFYVFMRFLLNRYEGDTVVKEILPITVSAESSFLELFSQFRREKKHPVFIDYGKGERMSVDETDCLRRYFHDRAYRQTLGDAFLYK